MSDTERTRAVVTEYFRRLADRDQAGLVALFADEVRWDIPGATDLVPWIGPRTTRAEVAEFFATFDDYIARDRFTVHRIVADGQDAVALGELRSRVRATGQLIESPFAIHLTVADGKITRYVLLEDSWRVAEAARP
ncbi:hypothetical protein SAMN05421810_109229 [Amycolatopsis arida]|uniref:SnoaL-like domain-containing protein n=1 Tax=Amycolatopsis arida TaxID=587909 RepID=A0A1I5ZIR6_9PSEU|nr:nuclear transport factor 2 family protein [Amycolatopsis arida]TDX89708.1 hypothetical protein CLV69_109229 [Amycolatopsis arida]SFQ56263.1 hypothetical protein SAMN05421810_109229 [Amycolatopsis arida]